MEPRTSTEKRRYRNKALVLGRIGLVRCLGREGIPVTLVRESGRVFERWSRYSREFILLPNLTADEEAAVQTLLQYGRRQNEKPVVFLSAELDVLAFSRHRDRLSEFFHITLPSHELLVELIDKARFARLAEAKSLPVPRTLVPQSREEFFEAAEEIGYPCVVKPVSQRLWHATEIIAGIGLRKALLVKDADELDRVLGLLPPVNGNEMLQEYVAGTDDFHYSFHTYINSEGTVRGSMLGQKLRTFPIHFGQGCYTKFVDEPAVKEMCLDVLKKINYSGVATVNVKRHGQTGKDYILEINPRHSLWGVLDSMCGVNLPLLQYCDALGLDIADQRPTGRPHRWLCFGADFKAMLKYRKAGQLTLWQWLTSYFRERGKIEYHVFAPDDPLPVVVSAWNDIVRFFTRGVSYIRRRISP
jgi:D-aspartate ligase